MSNNSRLSLSILPCSLLAGESGGIEVISRNIENQVFPFADETIDFVIANQVIEHTKEIYWINHEIFRTLKVGGYLWLGVPNVL
ncbi:methyltransferase domain-containing protein [Merismopedia glauca]|uniref:methyltransferase domain-containing protein n=1 Tax=Merismopedia glauca TaxID=292586 RepID=UPI001C6334E4|nr:methyltransferase domain-containing protein [Merismopedia glauca]